MNRRFYRGAGYGLLFSAPFWAVIGCALLSGCSLLADPEALAGVITQTGELAVQVAAAHEQIETIRESEWTTGEKIAAYTAEGGAIAAFAAAIVQKLRGPSATEAERKARKEAKA